MPTVRSVASCGMTSIDTGIGDTSAWTVGGEYAAFMGNTTLAGSLSDSNVDDLGLDVWGLGGEYRIFASDDLRFDLGAGYLRADAGGGSIDGLQVGAGVEYRFSGTPFSLGANVAYVDADVINTTTIGLSLRFDFGNGFSKRVIVRAIRLARLAGRVVSSSHRPAAI